MSDYSQKHQIFLSHSSKDKPEVLKFAALLKSRPLAKEHDIDVWVDKTHIREGDDFTDQFIDTLDSPDTCAFILFVPHEVTKWVAHEIKSARKRHIKDDVDKKKLFPIFFVYPGPSTARPPPPEEILGFTRKEYVYENIEAADEILSAIVSSFTGHDKTVQQTNTNTFLPTKPEASTDSNQQDQWLNFSLSFNGDQVICDDDTHTRTQCPKHTLQTAFSSPQIQHVLHQLFPLLLSRKAEEIARVRLMTNEPELAMMNWVDLLPAYVVEVSPLQSTYPESFDKQSVLNPLVVLPAGHAHRMAAGQHFTLLQGYFREYLGLEAIPRVTTAETLKYNLQFNPPDLIYIFACLNQQSIQLDASSLNNSQHDFSSVSPDELGQWIAQTNKRPLLVANFIGEELSSWPESLVKSCRMVWIQSSHGNRKLNQLTGSFLSKLEQLPEQTDLVHLINSEPPPLGVKSHLWINGKSPRLDTDKTGSLSGELRLALLRVMLGRDNLKQSMYGHINDNSNTHAFMTYAVTGSQTACPFDFPAQLQQRLEDWDAKGDEGLPVIPYHFSLTIDNDQPSPALIAQALDEGLLRYAYDPEEAFERELKRRRLLSTYKCITLNWYIRISKGREEYISDWLAKWGTEIHNELSRYIPAQSLLLAALCIEVDDPDDAQAVQNLANDALDQLYQYRIGFIENREALGKLAVREIRNFLTAPKWHQQLKLDQSPIDPNDYAQWVHKRTNKGEFEATITLLWQQYQNNYQDYLQP